MKSRTQLKKYSWWNGYRKGKRFGRTEGICATLVFCMILTILAFIV